MARFIVRRDAAICRQLGPKRKSRGHREFAAFDLGFVKTCAREEGAELFSLLSSLKGSR
jgi:hypothetical protein